MEKLLFLAFIVGSTINLAFEDVFSGKILPKPSFLAHLFLILAYILLFHGLVHGLLFFAFVLLLGYLSKRGIRLLGLGDAAIYLMFLEFNPILFYVCLVPHAFIVIKENRSAEFLPSIALYLTALLLSSL